MKTALLLQRRHQAIEPILHFVVAQTFDPRNAGRILICPLALCLQPQVHRAQALVLDGNHRHGFRQFLDLFFEINHVVLHVSNVVLRRRRRRHEPAADDQESNCLADDGDELTCINHGTFPFKL
jgi:hypothetical protein